MSDFDGRLRGTLFRPVDDGYDETREVWNALIDRRPSLIAQFSGTADVIASVNFARDHDLIVSVRGGGPTSPATPSATTDW